jgi:hypothetical protein
MNSVARELMGIPYQVAEHSIVTTVPPSLIMTIPTDERELFKGKCDLS